MPRSQTGSKAQRAAIGRIILLLLLASACRCSYAQAPAAPSSAPTSEQVWRAVEHVRADPLLGHTETGKTLRLKWREEKPLPAGDSYRWGGLKWLLAFMAWVAKTLRFMVWALGALTVALVLVGLRRWVRVHGAGDSAKAHAPPPSHVQSLDIRPESLPDVIGAVAAGLWQRGQQRTALSLLYRGALSRLVHVHALPIRAANTEGECLALANDRLDARRAAFFARLVGVWLHAVYGARLPDTAQALGLCREFDRQFAPVLVPAVEGAA